MKFVLGLIVFGELMIGSGCGQEADLPRNSKALFAEDATAPAATTETTATLGEQACRLLMQGPFIERTALAYPFSDALTAPTFTAQQTAYQVLVPEITDSMYEAGQHNGTLRFEAFITATYRVFLTEDVPHDVFTNPLDQDGSAVVLTRDTMNKPSTKFECKIVKREYSLTLTKGGTYFFQWHSYAGTTFDRTLFVMLPVTDAVDAQLAVRNP